MRAKGTLAAFCVLIGATVVTPGADAAERRAAHKQGRSSQAVAAPQRAASPTTANPATRQSQARVTTTKAERSAQSARRTVSNQRQASAAVPTHRRGAQRTEQPRLAATSARWEVPRTSMAVTPVASFGVMRPAYGAGSPILPVASGMTLSCVPFARMATGMNISGNGGQWWHNAAGLYARGQQPERGSVLAFAGSGGMSRGHVAVVSRVLGPRTIHIDHANWGGPGIRPGSIMRGVEVQDVSDRNDWTAIRVQVGYDSSQFGRTYGAYGFIYNRGPGARTMTAEGPRYQEVAEGPSPHAAQHLRLTSQLFSAD